MSGPGRRGATSCATFNGARPLRVKLVATDPWEIAPRTPNAVATPKSFNRMTVLPGEWAA